MQPRQQIYQCSSEYSERLKHTRFMPPSLHPYHVQQVCTSNNCLDHGKKIAGISSTRSNATKSSKLHKRHITAREQRSEDNVTKVDDNNSNASGRSSSASSSCTYEVLDKVKRSNSNSNHKNRTIYCSSSYQEIQELNDTNADREASRSIGYCESDSKASSCHYAEAIGSLSTANN